jgi:hypothetical protein
MRPSAGVVAGLLVACLVNFGAGMLAGSWVASKARGEAAAAARDVEIARADAALRASVAAADAMRRLVDARAALEAAGVSSQADFDALTVAVRDAEADADAKRAAMVTAVAAWSQGR